jgi:hypothetical protein
MSALDESFLIPEQFVIYRQGEFPQIQKKTPRQGGSHFSNFRRWDEESFLKACKYCGLTKKEINTARAQAKEAGAL